MESILTSIKKLLGPSGGYTHFDTDLIMHINSIFAILTQIGVGPSKGFSIEGADAVWTDFIPNDIETLEFVKSYMYLKVKLIFDPPLSSAVIESMKQMAGEFEWRIQVAAESVKKEEG
jgi:hypothetical protein